MLFEERQSQGDPRGKALARFLGSFFGACQRMNINTCTAQREAVCASKEEVVENLAYPPPFLPPLLDKI
jgi:hypothetical protein